MDCKRAKGLVLSEYADGVLKGHALEELESHLRSCLSCRRLAEDMRSTCALLKSAPRLEAPRAVWDRLRFGISKLSAKKTFAETIQENLRYGFYRIRPAIAATAAITVLLFVLATARFVSQLSYPAALPAGEDIINMVSLNGDAREDGSYDIGTSAETYFL